MAAPVSTSWQAIPHFEDDDGVPRINGARTSGVSTPFDPSDCPVCGLDSCPGHPADADAAAPMGSVVAAETIRVRTAKELASETPMAVDWYVPGFIAPGVILELAGKLKASGKTTFTAAAVRAVLNGLPFLSQPTRPTGGVFWLTEEQPTTFKETLKRADLLEREDVHIVCRHDIKHLPWRVAMRAAVKQAKAVNAGILIIDTVSQLAGLRGESENNVGDALEAIAPLQDAAAEGLAVIAIRHERKGGGEVGESGRGSSAFSGAVDIVAALRRGEGQTKPTVRVLHTLSRFTETPDTLVIDLQPTGGYVALGSEGTVAVLEAERVLLDRLPATAEAAASLEDIRRGDPLLARTAAQAAMKRLLDAGSVLRTGTGKKKDAYRFFRAIEDAAATQTTEDGSKQESDGAVAC